MPAEGETGRIETADALAEAALEIARGAHRKLSLFSQHLDPQSYGTPEFEDAVRALAIRDKHSSIRILVRASDRVMLHGGHRLVELARRVPSRIAILQADDIACEESAEWLINEHGALIRRSADEPTSVIRADDAAQARQLQSVFDRYWGQGRSAPELARLAT